MSLKNHKILLGISGGIAAYKSCLLIRLLVKAGAEVKVVLTKAGAQFVTKTTLETLSGNPVACEMFPPAQFVGTHHISYAEWADLIVLAPATANLIGKIANGIADDLLTTLVMAKQSAVMIAPAMNTEMYNNPIVQENIAKLKERGYLFLAPASGELACGSEGVGRLAEPEEIFTTIERYFQKSASLAGKRVVVTAGPTRERIDPVRYISNFSSGKMGYALATEAVDRGAEVVLISGLTALVAPAGVRLIPIESAAQLQKKVKSEFARADILIMAAAVADFRPAETAKRKLGDPVPAQIKLKPNPDILAEVGRSKKKSQVTVGFALEVGASKANALRKLKEKNLDLIVMNDPTVKGAEFGGDYNIATIYPGDGGEWQLARMTKRELAAVILDKIEEKLATGGA
ncbi:MAG: bifunctional phosphopantothenoylcysteine decarboxylase/phosphopantothenate--cysteine ligase CoaBC [candidate division Zixibacteria bacterium]|nr:bifunctional phosphopantothenoylcysteine decarboxylase/phosphopantothenate--cysteine ligase CoaBC [candidate division Zixibacteria bacterium]